MASKAKSPKGGSRTKLEKAGFAKAEVSLKELRKALKDGQRYAAREEWDKALPPLLMAWEAMPEDTALLTIIAQGLSRLGVREHAIAVLERALSIGEPTEDLCSIMLVLAIEMEFFDIAVQLGLQTISMYPTSERHYVNLATAYSGANKLDESISMLQEVLPLFPKNSDLWNVLATQVRERDGVDAADVFFQEAYKLNPRDLKILSNYAISFVQRGRFEEALQLNREAIAVNPGVPEPHVGTGQLLFLEGALEEGWTHYKHRLNPRRKQNQTQVYSHGLDDWQGQDLSGKTLFICAEQGIGDEVMFGNYLPFLYDRADKLIIGCERRLVSLYKRRFPNAYVDFFVDQFEQGYRFRHFPNAQQALEAGELKADFAIPLASAPSFEWKTTSAIHSHPEGFLKPCLDRQKDFEGILNSISSKPKVGLAWRSGIVSQQRSYLYSSIESFGPVMEMADKVDFVNLQYGEVTEELDKFQELYGVTVHRLEDVDLRTDIEANVAIMANCDAVLSACSAPGMFAMSSGRPTVLTSAHKPWWCFGREDKVPFAEDADYIVGGEEIDWANIMERAASKLVEKVGL